MTVTTVEVAVIGAGASGIGAAIKLRDIGVNDFVVLEKGPSVGGTWRDNTYPGCACDVPSTLYSYSFAQNPGWSRVFAGQAEILDYLERTATHFGVLENVRFGVEVQRAEWDDKAAQWLITTSHGEVRAQTLIGAAGPWHEPNVPNIPGLDSFTGTVFHSARWNHHVDLSGKRVAVVGTGASAVQFVPEIAPMVAGLHLFQRTPHWVLPKPDGPIPRQARRAIRAVPGLQKAMRGTQYSGLEVTTFATQHPWLQPLLKAVGAANIRVAIKDRQLRKVLTPDWPVGCKRILVANSYYPALARDNVHVHPTAVREIRGNVIVGADGTEAEVDVLILGTGFKILDMPLADRVVDGTGRSLADHWQGSPQAHLGTTVAGFPNFYLLLGPNLGSSMSAFSIIELQLGYIMQALTHQRASAVSRLQVRREVQDAYNRDLQSALSGTVYAAGNCPSYFVDRNGRNSFSWPWSTRRMASMMATFDPADFHVARPAADGAAA